MPAKKNTTTRKARVKSSTKTPKKKKLTPEEMHPFKAFPYRLEYWDGNENKICHFDCDEQRQAYIKRYKLRKNKYTINDLTIA